MSVVTVGVTATEIVGANTNRHSIIISNESTDTTVYFGPDTSITAADYPSIAPGGNFTEDSGATNTFKGAFYGIVSAGTASVRVWERNQ